MINYDDLNSDIYIAIDEVIETHLHKFDIYPTEYLGSNALDDAITQLSDEVARLINDRIKEEFLKNA